jgi:hypothetical protein
MKTETKKKKVKKLVTDMIKYSNKEMLKKIDKAINSGAINFDDWAEDNTPMILPKSILLAILMSELTQYEGIGTSYEKKVKKEAKNIQYFI